MLVVESAIAQFVPVTDHVTGTPERSVPAAFLSVTETVEAPGEIVDIEILAICPKDLPTLPKINKTNIEIAKPFRRMMSAMLKFEEFIE